MLGNLNNRETYDAFFQGFALLALALSIYSLGRKYRRNRLLARQGLLQMDVVMRRRIERGKYTSHKIDYEYEVDGQRYERQKHHVYADTFSRLKEGDQIQVKYLPKNPTQSKLLAGSDAEDYDWGCVSIAIC